MPVHSKRLTDSNARQILPPASGYAIHWCPDAPGFGLRVTSAGAKSWISERRIEGKTVRRTIGKADGRSAITAKAARELQVDISSELQQGKDRLEVKREKRKAEKVDALTLDAALRHYVKNKTRSHDGLTLKPRTKADYLGMIDAGSARKQPGALFLLAAKPLHRITAKDIKELHSSLKDRGPRRQTYPLQVLRAVLNECGVQIEGNPLSPSTPGNERVRLAKTKGKPTAIPTERRGAWWRAAGTVETIGADQLKFQLLTGCRPGEVAGIRVRDFNPRGERVKLLDTKNRTDFTIFLSKQAVALASKHAEGKKADDLLFGVADAGKSLVIINALAEVEGITPHKLRHTFASIAATLVPAFTLRKMINHADDRDTAAVHYVEVDDAQLRAGWQAVADYIEAAK